MCGRSGSLGDETRKRRFGEYVYQNVLKTMKISMEINGNQWKSMEINEIRIDIYDMITWDHDIGYIVPHVSHL